MMTLMSPNMMEADLGCSRFQSMANLIENPAIAPNHTEPEPPKKGPKKSGSLSFQEHLHHLSLASRCRFWQGCNSLSFCIHGQTCSIAVFTVARSIWFMKVGVNTGFQELPLRYNTFTNLSLSRGWVMFFPNERFGWFGCGNLPWQVFRGTFATLSPKLQLHEILPVVLVLWMCSLG